jgi:carbon storage regulator
VSVKKDRLQRAADGDMLYLTRKIGDSIIINDDIEVTVVDVRGKSIKLGLTFPEDVSVYRHEVYERIQAEKAGEGAADDDGADAPDDETTAETTDGPAE